MGKFWVQQWQKEPEWRLVVTVAGLFWGFTLFFSLHRYYTFYSNTDHGIFHQVFWNNLQGHFFQSSLSSSLSTNVIHSGEVPSVSYHRLGQHFTPALLLWLPIYALFPYPTTLNLIQVTLMTLGGLVLYFLAREYLQSRLALMITLSYYGANAIIGPTLGNFFDLCQLPVLAFGMLLAQAKRIWWLFWLLAIVILAIREDAGVILVGLGVYWVVSRRSPLVGSFLCMVSLAYMLCLTNLVMPLFSDDIAKRFMIERFGHFANGEEATTLDILRNMITHPGRLFVELISPIDRKITYLLGHWLPLSFVPSIAPAAWLSTSFPLAQLFLQQGDSRFAINIRYAVALIPGLFYGTIIWWSQHPEKFKPKTERFWKFCLILSLILTFTSNPHRAWFFLIPDSISPWIYRPLTVQYQHVNQVNTLIRQIPAEASVAASRYLVPQLSGRRAILRFSDIQFRDEQGQVQSVDYIIVDLWQLNPAQAVSERERTEVAYLVPPIDQLLDTQQYGIIGWTEQTLLMKRGVASSPEALAAWLRYRQHIDPFVKAI